MSRGEGPEREVSSLVSELGLDTKPLLGDKREILLMAGSHSFILRQKQLGDM